MKKNRKPKIVFFDLETSPMLVASFGLFPESIGHNNIINDWFIICAAWKEFGVNKTEALAITKPGDDYAICKKLQKVLSEADIVAGHNIKKFDLKKLTARLMHHRLPPLPNFQVIDTLTEMRRCAANVSNRLDYLTKSLVGDGKYETSTGLWLKAMNADKKAIREMVEYNKVDVIRNEQLYKIMKPYMKSHPHIGAISGHDRNLTCPKCGSDSFDSSQTKLRYTAAGLPRIQKQCNVCHSYTTFK